MRIVMWKRFSYALAIVALAAIAVRAKDVRTIQMRDDCDPATFDAAVGPGTCVGDGDTLFQDFIDEVLGTGSAEKWRFNSDRTEADRAVNAENRGGETHSFTEVNHFGGGFIPVLNGGQVPLVECAARDQNGALIPDGKGNFVPALPAILSFVPSGGRSNTVPLSRGTHKFQCCIHPWMQSTVTVR
jgi:hypothetical protein